ncbi:hypothetical protein HGRIS_001597 [Hohenbuehelia grisea]|uniref:DUF6830 domain-containing protein n=1 Tax=Hohenbuehelia grisea TaxID=104357 RepID=A0ABR3JIU4_9AGAR
MSLTCPACQENFSKSGLKHHKRLTKDPLCLRYWKSRVQLSDESEREHDPQSDLSNSDALSSDEEASDDEEDFLPKIVFGPTVEQDEDDMASHREFALGFDPAGDALGDYDDLDEEDVEMDEMDEDDKGSDGSGDLEATDDSGDSDGEEEECVTLEPQRPRRPLEGATGSQDAPEEDNPNIRNAQLQRDGAERQLQYTPHVVEFPGAAGMPTGTLGSQNGLYASGIPTENNPYAPFLSRIDWEVAQWAKLRGPGSTALTELLQIPGVPERLGLSFYTADELNKKVDEKLPGRPRFVRHEVCEVFYRDIIACVKAIFGDPDFTPYLVFKPEKHYTDTAKTQRMYHDMHTGRWWWATQAEVERERPGATIIPIIISTDKTQLTLFRNKTAYPVYMTIGNIPKEIRRKPSSRAYILLGYLPTTKLEQFSNKAARRRMLANLYHACMKKVLQPLETAGISGLSMVTGSGTTHRAHPIFACFVSDYPEQILVALGYTGKCACCKIAHKNLGDYAPEIAAELRDLAAILEILDSFDSRPEEFLKSCAEAGVKPVIDPFWINLPYTHIFRSITPDVLHQLYQGIIKHLVAWLIEVYGAAEIDARCRRMPPIHHIRIFGNGISSLSKVTGREHDQICRILLGLVLDMPPLDTTVSPAPVVRCVRAILDFLYLAQYPIHTDDTLALLDDALARFHADKGVFIDLGIREDFNLPKLHFALHYSQAIRLFCTTDNFNTEYTERLHIDFTKDAYRATNRKDEFTQMTTWLERREKVHRHGQFIAWRLVQSGAPPKPRSLTWSPPGLDLDRRLHLAKRPSATGVTVQTLATKYGARYFKEALARFITLTNEPGISRARLEQAIWNIHLPFRKVSVWHRIKFLQQDPLTLKFKTADSIHA